MRNVTCALFSLSALLGWSFLPALAADPQADSTKRIPAEVRALTGTFTGEWTMFGIDDRGNIVKRMAWTDTMKALTPDLQNDRASVSTIDEMTFIDSKAPPFKVEGREGYYFAKDGGLGDYFIETYGQVHRLSKLEKNVWTYAAPAADQELARMGFPKVASGQHVVVKVVTTESGLETHRISRVTTVTWKDPQEAEQTMQFVSLQGYHRRQP